MRDPRLETLARQLIRYSCAMKPGERVLIENFGVEPEAVTALIREAYAAGAEPIVVLRDMAVQRALMLGATAEKWDEEARIDADRMRAVDVKLIYLLRFNHPNFFHRLLFRFLILCKNLCKNQLIYRVNFPITIILCNLQEG